VIRPIEQAGAVDHRERALLVCARIDQLKGAPLSIMAFSSVLSADE
jgi:hypothetical protein